MKDLNNKIVLITGAFGHFGQAITKCLSDYNATILATGRNIEKYSSLDNVCNNIIPLVLDISNVNHINNIYNYIQEHYNKIDVIVNNAYYAADKNSTNEEKYIQSYSSCVVNVATLVEKLLPLFPDSGSIVNIASMYGNVSPYHYLYDNKFEDYRNPPFYGAAKAGLIQWTRFMACKLGKQNIRVNSISPGPFPSQVVQKNSPDFVEALSQKVPLGRIGDPMELANVVAFLASDMSSYITGHDLKVDGGWTAW